MTLWRGTGYGDFFQLNFVRILDIALTRHFRSDVLYSVRGWRVGLSGAAHQSTVATSWFGSSVAVHQGTVVADRLGSSVAAHQGTVATSWLDSSVAVPRGIGGK
jgi:hypothetical protein